MFNLFCMIRFIYDEICDATCSNYQTHDFKQFLFAEGSRKSEVSFEMNRAHRRE